MPWIVNEDGALKSKLSGLKVTDGTAPDGRNVAVRFRLPETELADETFPMIVIDHSRLSRADTREHRGFIQLRYSPEGFAPWADMTDPSQSPYYTEQPIPYNLDYQVSVVARKAQHLMSLIAQLAAFDYLPARFGYLKIPQDGTVRSMDLLGGPEMITLKDENGKRLLRAVYLIRVYTEFLEYEVQQFVPVEEIDLDLYTIPDHLS